VGHPALSNSAFRSPTVRGLAYEWIRYSPGLPLLDRIHSSSVLIMRPPLASGSFSLMWILHHLDRNLDQRARQR
jgi:hypothetical protein